MIRHTKMRRIAHKALNTSLAKIKGGRNVAASALYRSVNRRFLMGIINRFFSLIAMRSLLLSLALSVLLVFSSRFAYAQSDGGSTPDSLALVALFNATNGTNWATSTNWLQGPLSTWHGVTVDRNGRVTELNLGSNQLAGSIPSDLGQLTELQVLLLHQNQLTGAIPDALGNLFNLRSLDFGNNQLTGAMPATFGQLGSLQQLVISFNQLNGPLPTFWSEMGSLTQIILTGNQFTGGIPSELGDLVNLEVLHLDNNQLDGTFPSALANLSLLRDLFLGGNQFSGPIPTVVTQLSGLMRLVLRNNNFDGPIPPELSQLGGLQNLFLDGNDLTGAIPSGLGALTSLQELSLGGNQLSGALPASFGGLASLVSLDVQNNPSLEGPLPVDLTSLSNITQFLFNGTNLCEPQDSPFQGWLSTIETVQSSNIACQAVLTVSPQSFDFQGVPIGNNAPLPVEFRNTGVLPLDVTSALFSGEDADAFSISSPHTGTLNPNETLNVTVTFAPTRLGTHTVSLDVTSDANNASISFTGEGTQGSQGVLSVSPQSLDFGNVGQGQTSTLPVMLTNTGTAPLNVVSTTFSGDDASAFTAATDATGILQPQESRNVSITFGPSRTGNHSASLEVDSDVGALSVALKGVGAVGQLSVNPQALDYGNVAQGQTKTLQVTLTNTGASPFNLTGASFSGADAGYFVMDADVVGPLQPQESRVVNLAFTPERTGSHTASFDVTSDVGNASVPLMGSGTLAELSVNPQVLDFGMVAQGQPTTLEVTVTNTGTGMLNVTGATFSGTDAAAFTLSNTAIGPLQPQQSRMVDVTFTPARGGSHEANLDIATDVAGSVAVSLTGKGLAGVLSVAPESLNYGNVAQGQDATLQVTLTNTGDAPLSIIGTAFSGADGTSFGVGTDPLGPLQPQESRLVDVKFAPTRAGSHSASFDVISDGGDGSVALIGTGIRGELTLVPQALNFGTVEQGLAGTQQLMLSNTGTAPLNVTSAAFTDADAAAFSFVGDPTGILQPQASRSVDVLFRPARLGAHTASIQVLSDVRDALVTLTGTGSEASLTPLQVDSLALVALYNATNGPNWATNTNWLTGPLSTWHGVVVSDGRVTSVSLGGNQLTGTLPDALGDLSALISLGLEFNQISGSIPTTFGQMSSLQVLLLTDNTLSGPIPTELGQLTDLVTLELGANDLTGTIPAAFQALTALRQLTLNANELDGPIPVGLRQLTELRTLWLDDNALTGGIPPWLGELVQLRALHLGTNPLEGSIPPELGSLANLEVLLLNNSQLDGTIPPVLGQLSKLRQLALEANQLEGIIPPSLGELANLEVLRLDTNQLTGMLPSAFGGLTNLVELEVQENPLVGPLPPELTALAKLETFRFNNTNLCEPQGATFQAWLGGITALFSSGIACQGILTVAPTAFDFADVQVGMSASASVTFSNTGNFPLEVTSALFSGPDAAAFSLAGTHTGILNPTATLEVTITFAPTRPGSHSASLDVTSDANNAATALMGEGTQGVLTVDPHTLAFGNVMQGQTGTLQLTFTNTGTAPLSLTGAAFAGADATAFGISADPSGPLQPQESQVVDVTFAPTRTGSHTARLDVTSDVGDASVAVSGEGTQGMLTVDPQALDFGGLGLGQTGTLQVMLTNMGTAPLNVTDAVLSGDDAAAFALASTATGPLPPQAQRTVDVTFTPSRTGSHSASLDVTSNAGEVSVVLSGEGTEGMLAATPELLAFGMVVQGQTATLPVTLTNTGTAPLEVTAAVLSGDDAASFSLGNTVSGTLQPQEVREVLVTFAPTRSGGHSASIALQSTAGSATVDLVGEAIVGILEVAPLALDFGELLLGETTELEVTLSNTGTAPLEVTDAVLSGSDVAVFTLVGSLTGVLAPDASRSARVAFSPSQVGDFVASLEVTSDVGEVSIPLTGEGAGMGVLAVDSEVLAFGPVELGQQTNLQVTLTNTGTAPLVIIEATLAGDDADAFTQTNTVTGVLAPDASRSVDVAFAPERLGAHTAQLNVQSDAGTTRIDLRGDGIVPPVVVTSTTPTPTVDDAFEVLVEAPTSLMATIRFRQGGATGYQTQPLEIIGDALQGTVAADFLTARGLEYYFEFSDGQMTFTLPAEDPEDNPFRVQVQVPELMTPRSFQPRRYQMVSVPLLLDTPSPLLNLEDDHGPYAPQVWRLLKFVDGGYIEGDDLPPALMPGEGFWYIHAEGRGFDVGAGRSVPTTEPFRVTLEPGWNHFGNPFAFPIAWADVMRPPDVEPPVGYDGIEYLMGQAVLQPWECFFIFNRADNPVDVLLPPRAAPLGKSDPHPQFAYLGPDDWVMRIAARVPERELRDTQTFVGELAQASTDRDAFDFLDAPPPPDGGIQVAIEETWGEAAGSFRPPNPDGHAWTLLLRGPVPLVHLSVASVGPRTPTADWVLLDETGVRIQPTAEGTYPVSLRQQPRRLRLLAGSEAFIEETAAQVVTGFALLPTYPNPFAQTTEIRYTLDEATAVELVMYNVLGQEVQRWAVGEQAQGVHRLTWDGRDRQGRPVSPGLYVCTLRAGSHQSTQTMVRIR